MPPTINNATSDSQLRQPVFDSSAASVTESISSPDRDIYGLRFIVEELQSELRHVKAEISTYKQFVDEMRLLNQTPPPHSTNWAEAQNCINLINSILNNPHASNHHDREMTSSQSVHSQGSMSPPVSDSITQERNQHPTLLHQNIPAAMIILQREVDWMIGHMAGQDQRIIDLKMELDNLKQDIVSPSAQLNHPSPSAPPSVDNEAPSQVNLNQLFPPPPQFTDVTTDAPIQENMSSFIPNIPTRNRFDVLTTEDDLIYSPNDMSPAAPQSSRPAPIPKPRKPKPAPRPNASKRRPKVSNVGSSMFRDQDYHQNARGLDATCHAFSGRRAEEVETHVATCTSDDDDVIVLGGGTNNVPRDDVVDIIVHIGRLIDHTRELRPNNHIIIPQMLLRYDSDNWVYHNEKIRRVNIFLKHRCKRDDLMHFLPLDVIERDDLYDGLHLDYIGKDKFAAAVADLVLSLDLA